MTPSVKNTLVGVVAGIVAVIGGIEVFVLVFGWPTFTDKHQDLMLGWGLVGWIPGIPLGIYSAVLLWRFTKKVLLTPVVSKKDRLYALTWLFAVGAIGLFAVFLINFGNVNVKWQEEVRMADGETLLLNRRSKGGKYKEKEMSLEVVKSPANWQKPPIWHEEYVPILLDYQPEGQIWSVVATFHRCKDRGWSSILPYIEYQSKDGEPWEVIPLEERLIDRNTNLLISPNYEGEAKLVTVEERDKRSRSAANDNRKILSEARTNCPYTFLNPQLEAAMEKNAEAEKNALTLTAKVTHSSDSPIVISQDDYRTARGDWSGSGSISSNCKEILEGIWDIRQNRNGGSWLAGNVVVMKNGYQIPIERTRIAGVVTVACSKDGILVVRRPDKEQLIVHGFSQTGNLMDAVRVNLPNLSNLFPEREWPIIWKIQIDEENLIVVFGDYSPTTIPHLGGVLKQQVTFTAQLH